MVAVGVPTAEHGWEIRYGPEIPVSESPDPKIAVRETTERCAQAIEAEVRARPELWLWMYKRWKYIPEGEEPDRYPFYARGVQSRVASRV